MSNQPNLNRGTKEEDMPYSFLRSNHPHLYEVFLPPDDGFLSSSERLYPDNDKNDSLKVK